MKNTIQHHFLIPSIICICSIVVNAQNISINNSNALPDPSAMLDVSSPNKGVLIPRVSLSALTDAATVPNAATGLLIYNTGGNLSSGFYYNQGTPAQISWMKLQSGTSNDWAMNGNQASSNDFVGTTNGMPLKFKVNGENAGIISFTADNVALGRGSLSPSTSGTGNVAIGTYILQSNTTGTDNTAMGRQALSINLTGAENVAIGAQSLSSNTSGSKNTSVGNITLHSNTTGYENTALGYKAQSSNQIGVQNVALGAYALSSNTDGQINTAVGHSAMKLNTLGNDNTAIGAGALFGNTVGTNNSALGTNALRNNDDGVFNVAIGVSAMYQSINGDNNVALGVSAMHQNTSGYSNVAIGRDALYLNTIRNNIVAVGDSSLLENGLGASGSLEATKNTAVGSKALMHNNVGYENTGIGYHSLTTNTTGHDNTAVGKEALSGNTTGYYNIAIGDSTLSKNTTGNYNVSVGSESQAHNLNGSDNVGVGDWSLYHLVNSTKNSAIGNYALNNLTTGYENSGIGFQAMYGTSFGFGNSSVGRSSLSTNTTGNSNSAFGYYADVAQANLDHATAIGAGAVVNCSNCLVLGGTGSASTFVGINNTTPTTDLTIKQKSDSGTSRGMKIARSTGSNYWRTYMDSGNALTFEYNDLGAGSWAYITTNGQVVSGSDIRIKKDIVPMTDVLEKVKLLTPKSFHYLSQEETDPIQYGFIAQEVEAIYPDVVYTREDGTKGIAYQQFTSIAIQAIKEQEVKIDDLQRQIDELKALITK